MRAMVTGFLLAFGTMMAVTPALAQDAEPRLDSLTISPFHMLVPMFEASYEMHFNEAVSMAVITGFGQQSNELTTVNVSEIGTQMRYYFSPTYEGLHAGFEALYVTVSGDDAGSVEVAGEGLAIGPLMGWKFVLDSGLTFDLQGGYQFLVVKAEGEDTATGDTASESEEAGVPLVNINVGWSF